MQGFISTFSNAVVDFCRRAIIVYKMRQKQIKHMFGPKGINYFLNTTRIYHAKILLHGYSKLKQHKDLCHVEHYNMTRFGWICSEKLRWKKKQETKLDLDERYTLNARKWRKKEWINCCIHAKRGRVFESITKIGVSRFLIWLWWFRQSLSAWMFNLIRHRFCISNHGKDWLQWLRARGGHSIFFLLVCSFISYMESES